MRILFVCKHNRFRSKIAEALFKKYNKNKKIKVQSAGTHPDYIHVALSVVKVLRKLGVKNINRNPKKIDKGLIEKADLIVIVADNVDKEDLGDTEGKKVIYWKISDISQYDNEGILERAGYIEKRVKKLVLMLE